MNAKGIKLSLHIVTNIVIKGEQVIEMRLGDLLVNRKIFNHERAAI